MAKRKSQLENKIGLPPGSLVHVGKRKSSAVSMVVYDYNESHSTKTEFDINIDSFISQTKGSNRWLNINGLHDTEFISKVGKQYNLHPLLLEDILNTNHRPKFEDFDEALFLTLKMLYVDEKKDSIVSEQISLILGDHWIISFQEEDGDVFDIIRERLESSKSMLRKSGADYLFYRLIDTIVDNYFYVTEYLNNRAESLEEEVLSNADKEVLNQIQQLKKLLISFRRTVVPLRDALLQLQKEDRKLISSKTQRYIADVFDHVLQNIEIIEAQRELLATLMELYHTSISNRMNHVMQVLTIMSAIFIPLTFIAGIYGMNFDHMPELHWINGYFYSLGLMVIVVIGMLIFFKRRKWL